MNDNSQDSRVRIVGDRTLSDEWTRLTAYELDYTDQKGAVHRLKREIYHRAEAVAILLYDPERDIVVLVRQFRLPAYLSGHPAWLLEVPAGIVDEGDPLEAARREALEETGYRIRDARCLFNVFMSPGAIMERVSFFFARISASDRVEAGGGLDEENEDIEVLEVRLDDAVAMIESGEISDAKTIMLLQWAVINRASLAA